VRTVADTAHACEAERGTLTTMTMRLCGAIRNEPTGTLLDVSAVTPVTRRALAALDEAAMLDKMARTMRTALQNEPQGVLMDTSELQKQRAQIKICPTCGREL